MDQILAYAKGINGQLEVLADRVRITRKGLLGAMGHGLGGGKEIQISRISAIQMKDAGLLNGHIQFSFAGGREAKTGLLEAAKDENAITFKRSQQAQFQEAKRVIEERMRAGEPQRAAAAPSDADELAKLARLRDEGILTEEEFTAKKRQILGL